VVGEFGCGGVWSSPTLDVDTGMVYFGTANCPAVTPDNGLPKEAVYALDAETGALLWRFGPEDDGSDGNEDFGATTNLFRDDTGRKVLGAGRKDGKYYALDPATGELLWSTHVADPLPRVGGFIGSTAVFDGDVYGATGLGSVPAYHALDGSTGAVKWQALTTGPSYAGSAVVNGVVFAGALDATLKAFDADTGLPLWVSPTLGAISSAPAIVGDMVFVGSGTSTSDVCAQEQVYSELCFVVFDTVLGQTGGVHAFRQGQLPAIP
jgi:outer membrane protein assembly factor BamB